MNWVHLHLMTNHVPVVGMFIGVVILVFGMIRRSRDIQRFSLIYFVAIAILTFGVFLTGEPAEEAIESLAGISESAIGKHESASLYGLLGLTGVVALSLAGLLLKARQIDRKKWFYPSVLILCLATAGAMGWIANLGGKIRHSEIRGNQMSGEALPDERSNKESEEDEGSEREWEIREIRGDSK